MRWCFVLAAGVAGCFASDPALGTDVGDFGDASHDGRIDTIVDARPDGFRSDSADTVDAGPSPTKTPPGRPSAPDGPSLPPLHFSLRDIVLEQGGDVWESIGYDLDGHRTSSADDEFPCTPPAEWLPPFDGPGGVDNAFGGELLPILTAFDSSFQSDVQAEMLAGRTVVLAVRDWNGQDDDPRVVVEMVATLGVDRADGDTVPQWDGADRWITSASGYLDGEVRLRDDDAYVVGRTVVARLPSEGLMLPWLAGSLFELRFTDARVTAQLSRDTSRLNNVIYQGRFARVDVDAALETSGFCAGTVARAFMDDELDASLDMHAVPGSVGGTCDAISTAFELVGYRAGFARVDEAPSTDPFPCLP